MPRLIEKTFAELIRYPDRLPMELIQEWLDQTPLTAADLSDYLIFNSARYVRNRLHDGPAYQALLLCWRSGQRSPIHNHRGSYCGVRVLHGIATETLFARGPNGMVYPTTSRNLPAGFTCASADEDIHQISNLQASSDLITLHIYSPPLLRMDMFTLESPAVSEWDDPINDPFPIGAGI